MNLARPNFAPLQLDSMIDASEAIIVGRIVESNAGATLHSPGQAYNQNTETIVFGVEVTTAVKGARAGERLYFDMVRSPAMPAAGFAESLPSEPLVLFLKSRVWTESEEIKVVNPGSGYPDGQRLYQLVNYQGLVIECAEKLQQPLARNYPLFNADVMTLPRVTELLASRVSDQ